jgi:hypothetical protein
MAITKVSLQKESGKLAKKQVTTYTEVYHIETDDMSDKSDVVLADGVTDGTTAVPNYGAVHSGDVAAVVIGKSADRITEAGTCSMFAVTVTYSSEVSANQEEDTYGNPDNRLMELAVLDVGQIKYQEPFEWDLDGVPVVTEVGEPYNPRPMRDASRQVFTITRNEATAPSHLVGIPHLHIAGAFFNGHHQFINTVCKDEFFGLPAGSAKMESITSRDASFIFKDPSESHARHGDRIDYRIVTYTIHIAEEKKLKDAAGDLLEEVYWQLRLLHAGTQEKADVNGTKTIRRIYQDNAPVTDPWPLVTLDADGLQGAPFPGDEADQVVAYDPTNGNHQLEYQQYKRYVVSTWKALALDKNIRYWRTPDRT